MSDYSNTFGGAAKDAANSTILGADHDTEYDGIATMSATKANKTGAPATTNNLAMLTATGDLADSLVESDGSGNITANVTGNLTGNVTGNIATDSLTAATTNGDLPITRNGTGEITIDGFNAYGMVFLTTPQVLVNGSTTTGSWVQMDMSVVYSTASTNGARIAIVKVSSSVASGVVDTVRTTCYLRERGSGLAIGEQTVVTKSENEDSAIPGLAAYGVNTTFITLDSNSDFDWYHQITGATGTLYIYLIGYLV